MLVSLYRKLNMKFVNEYSTLAAEERKRLYIKIMRIRAILSHDYSNHRWLA